MGLQCRVGVSRLDGEGLNRLCNLHGRIKPRGWRTRGTQSNRVTANGRVTCDAGAGKKATGARSGYLSLTRLVNGAIKVRRWVRHGFADSVVNQFVRHPASMGPRSENRGYAGDR